MGSSDFLNANLALARESQGNPPANSCPDIQLLAIYSRLGA
jgi:hypothetical protein